MALVRHMREHRTSEPLLPPTPVELEAPREARSANWKIVSAVDFSWRIHPVHEAGFGAMNVSIVSRDELKLVGIEVVGSREELGHRVPLAWTELLARLDSIPHVVDRSIFYGSFPEGDHLRASADGVYTYHVGTEVSALGPLPEGLRSRVLPARTYATARVRGTAEAIEATYVGLAQWLEEQGRRTHPEAHGFERYDHRVQKVTPPYSQFDYDIFKPLEARG